MANSLLDNRVLWASFIAWAVAQISKTIYEIVRERKVVLSRIVSSGGMPSSHSALVTGLATATGRLVGVGSTMFAITVVLAGIVMYDAAGVRRAVSIQARILNKMLDEAFQ
jgi:acid phosphatase family membrane protein YuiD